MANERLRDADRDFLTGFREAAVGDVINASRSGKPEDVIGFSLRVARISAAISQIRGLYDQIDEIHTDLGLPVLPVDVFANFVPAFETVTSEVSPAVAEPPIHENGETTADLDVDGGVVAGELHTDLVLSGEEDRLEDLQTTQPFLPAVVTPSPAFSEPRPVIRPTPVLTESHPQRIVSAESLNGLPLEDKVLRAVFGLNFQRTQLYYNTFANSVNAVFGDSLPPRALNPDKSREEFGKALRQQGQIVDGFLASLRAVDANPNLATSEQVLKAKKLRDYLLEEGYPDNLIADDLSIISHRKWGFDFMVFLANLANRPASKTVTAPLNNGIGLDDDVDIRASDRRVHSGNKVSANQDSRDGVSLRTGFRPVKGPAYHVPKANVDNNDASYNAAINRATVGTSEQLSQIDRALGDAIFAVDIAKTPVNNSLAAVAETVFPKELEGLEGSDKDAKIKYLIETRITPYIADRMRALAVTTNPSANVTLRQTSFAKEVDYWQTKYGYPKGLSVNEIGRLMAKQVTLTDLIEIKNGASVVPAGRNNIPDAQAPSTPPEHEDAGRAENGVNHLRRKDRLTDAQRAYLEVVYETTDSGEMEHPTKDDSVRALYPKEYSIAVENPDRTHNMALLLAHFGRTGKKVRQMLEEFFATGVGPAELRAHVHKLRNNPSLAGLPDEVLVELSQR